MEENDVTALLYELKEITGEMSDSVEFAETMKQDWCSIDGPKFEQGLDRVENIVRILKEVSDDKRKS